jgi:hypothetical protein
MKMKEVNAAVGGTIKAVPTLYKKPSNRNVTSFQSIEKNNLDLKK